jgi:hypothetical protein
MYARVPDLYGMVAHDAEAAMADAQNSGLFRYAGYWPTGGLVNRPSAKPPCWVSIGVGAG